MTIETSTRRVRITLRQWNNAAPQWSPDVFSDLEVGFQLNHDHFTNPLDDLQEAEHLSTKYYFEDKWRHYQEYKAVKTMLPELVPDTVKGYLQIRTRQTKRFLAIQTAAEKQGFVFDFEKSRHCCRKYRKMIGISQDYDHSSKYPLLVAVQCECYAKGLCKGKDEFGLACVFPLK